MNAEQQNTPGNEFNYHKEIAELEAGWDGMDIETQITKLQRIFKVVHAEGITEGEFAQQMVVVLKMRTSVTAILTMLQTKISPKEKAPLPAVKPIKIKAEKPPKSEKQVPPGKQEDPVLHILKDEEMDLAITELREDGLEIGAWELACAIKSIYRYIQPKVRMRAAAIEKMVKKTRLPKEFIEAHLAVFDFGEEFRDLVQKGLISTAVLEKIHARCAGLGIRACQHFSRQLVAYVNEQGGEFDEKMTDEILDEIMSQVHTSRNKEPIRLDPTFDYSIDVKHRKASDFQGLWGEILKPLDPTDSAYADRKDDLKPREILVRVKSMRGRVATVRADILVRKA